MDEKFISYLINLSDSGGGVICKENLRIGSNIKLSFFGPDIKPVELIATIVRSKKTIENKTEYGIRYFNILPDAYQKIQRYIKRKRIRRPKPI
jgi:c-di-GMP-binding flagellar brake protein YcgR